MATVQQVFTSLPSLTLPVALKQAPGDPARWFAVEKTGYIRAFANDPSVSSTSVFLDIAARVNSGFNESGLLGMAFHPGWPTTLEVYVNYTAVGAQLTTRISRFQSVDGGQTLLAASEEILLEVIQPFNNHNGGDIAFGDDGYLYSSVGDGGSGGDPQGNGQNTATLLGSIIRIDVNGNTPYEIPGDNPFFGNGMCTQGSGAAACPEIFAWGLRNPWRMSFDSTTGDLWVADVGQGAWEEVNRVESGQNYGWNDREGAHCYEPAVGCDTSSRDPVTEYGRSRGQSITGGYVYRGSLIADLTGWYVFGDFVTGRIFAVPADSQPTVVPTEIEDTSLGISSFAEGEDGEIYVLQYSPGAIYQIVDVP